MVSKLLGLFMIGSCLAGSAFQESEVKALDADGPWEFMGVTGYAGTIAMNALTGSSLFYWLFEAIDGNITTDSLPLLLWLQGGPGCSGTFGMLWEGISPILVNNKSEPTRTSLETTWSTNYHLISIDFPYGAGYSFANSAGDNKNTTQAATLYLYNFLAKLNAKYPQWFNRTFYIFGESYGGHWVPGLAYNVLKQNAMNTGFNINLKGIGIGDPWVDIATQSQTYASYAYSASLINANEMSIVQYYQNLVLSQLTAGQTLQAESNWENAYTAVIDFSGGVNEYNIRTYSGYDESYLTKYMNKISTKSMLNINPNYNWASCNDTVYDYYKGDIANTSIVFFPYILSQGVTVMIYNGQDDLIVNSPGVENMIAAIDWPGAQGFAISERLNWTVSGNVAGYVQSYQNLTYVQILKSGHMAPYDQPVNVKDMVQRYINGTGWD